MNKTDSKFYKFIDYFVKRRLKVTFFIIVIILISYVLRRKVPNNLFNTNLGLIGTLITIVGIFIRSWAAGMIHKNKKVTTTGAYSLFRHPLYIGSLFMAIGFCVIIWDIYLIIVLLYLIFGIYYTKIKQEEAKLKKLFPGEYEQFMKETGIFFPKKISSKIFEPWSLNQWKKHKEYEAMLTGIIALILLYCWNVFF